MTGHGLRTCQDCLDKSKKSMYDDVALKVPEHDVEAALIDDEGGQSMLTSVGVGGGAGRE